MSHISDTERNYRGHRSVYPKADTLPLNNPVQHWQIFHFELFTIPSTKTSLQNKLMQDHESLATSFLNEGLAIGIMRFGTLLRTTLRLTKLGCRENGWFRRETNLRGHSRLHRVQSRWSVACLVPATWRAVNDIRVRAGMAGGCLRRGGDTSLRDELLRYVCLCCKLGMLGVQLHSWLQALTLQCWDGAESPLHVLRLPCSLSWIGCDGNVLRGSRGFRRGQLSLYHLRR